MNRIPSRPVEVFLQAHYLAKTFDAGQRLKCHLHNFAFLAEVVRPFSLADWFSTGLCLFERRIGEVDYRLRLSMPPMHRNQGELAMSLSGGDVDLYDTGFTIVPGELCGAPPGPALLISRMQGAAGRVEEIHQAAKAFRDITPQALIFAALQGFARALGLSRILGTSARVQLSYSLANPDHFLRCYDEFFESVDAALGAEGVYAFDCSKPISVFENLPLKHRSRTKAKRAVKAEIDALVLAAMREHVVPQPERDAPGALQEISAVYLATQVGERRGARIVTAGRAGLLVCGPFPYACLEPGRYEISFVFEKPSAPVRLTFDVAAQRGRRVLGQREIAGCLEASEVALRLETLQREEEVEFRVLVSETTSLSFRGVVLRRLR